MRSGRIAHFAKKPRGPQGRLDNPRVVSTNPIGRYRDETSVEWGRDRRGHRDCRARVGASPGNPVCPVRTPGQLASGHGGSVSISSTGSRRSTCRSGSRADNDGSDPASRGSRNACQTPGAPGVSRRRYAERPYRQSAQPRRASRQFAPPRAEGPGRAAAAGVSRSLSAAAVLPAALGLSATVVLSAALLRGLSGAQGALAGRRARG